MKNLICIAVLLISAMGAISASQVKSVEYTIRCIPIPETTILSNKTKRHSLVLKEGARECKIWLGDGEKPELNDLNLKPNTIYAFILVHHPDWAGMAIAQPGVTSPPGFLKRIMQGDRMIWEDVTFRKLGIW